MPVDISSIINIQSKTNNNIISSNNNMEPRETIPTLNLYQPKAKVVATTSKQEANKQDPSNQEFNKQESNIKEEITSPKNKELADDNPSNINDKKINLFELIPKKSINSVEYNLNLILKNNKSVSPNRINSPLFIYKKKNSKNITLNSNNLNPKNIENGIVILNNMQEEDDTPFNVSEISFPLVDEEKISNILKSNYYFQDQTQDIINLIITEIIYVIIPKETTIYNMNDLSNYYYIIKKGKVNLIRNKEVQKSSLVIKHLDQNIENINNGEKIFKTLGEWESFGEISFFNGKKRDEIVISEEDVELYLIDSESSRELLKRNNEIILKEKYNFLNNISIFESLDKISKYNVAQKLRKKEFPPNTKIISRGEIGDKLYIIKEGIVSCKIGVKEIRKISNNEYFGENTLLIEQKRGADIITLQKCICYELSKEDLKDALSKDFIDIILFCFFTYCINNNEYMKKIIIDSLIHSIFKCFSLKQYIKK